MRSLGEGAGPGNRCAGLVEKDIVAQRSLKIRVVENIEELYTKLSCESIGEEGVTIRTVAPGFNARGRST